MAVWRDDIRAQERDRKLRRISAIVTLVGVFGALAWDVVPYLNPARGDTISEVVRDWSKVAPIVPLFLGAVCGHWMWTWPVPIPDAGHRAVWLIIAFMLGIVASFVAWVVGMRVPVAVRIAIFAAGFVLGHFFWPLHEGGVRL